MGQNNIDWLVVNPLQGSGDTTLSITAAANTGSSRNCVITVKNTTYGITRTINVSQEGVPTPITGNTIFYTSTNGQVITIYEPAFGANIVSNTYVDGQGIIVFDNTITEFGSNAFYKCSNLSTIIIPNNITFIGDNAFYKCSGLTSIDLSHITYIDWQAFQYCASLTEIIIPNAITIISQNAFADCSGLTSVIIGNGVTQIDSGAFYGCSSLTEITCNTVTPPNLGYNVFDNTNECPIYVPASSVNAYKSASGWSTYASRIQAIPT